MDNLISIKITKASVEDAQEILDLQYLAYQKEAELYNDFKIPPLVQTLKDLEDQFKSYTILKAVTNNTIIGTVRAFESNKTCTIERLAVHPSHQNKGLGAKLMNEIEKQYDSQRFELICGNKSKNNIHLYKKLGYKIFSTSPHGCGGHIEVFNMEKIKN